MSLVGGIVSVSPADGGLSSPAGRTGARYLEERRGESTVDVYDGNSQAWRNRASSAGEIRACRCGQCPACVVGAYAARGLQTEQDEARASGEEGAARSGNESASPMAPKGVDGEVLSAQDRARLEELQNIDRAVRAHEQAHMAAAGGLVRRGVSLSYEKGPDGRRYAVGGEVSIDTSRESDPGDTVGKMRTVRAAALAPVDPSPQDRRVAAAAAAAMATAMQEVRQENMDVSLSGNGREAAGNGHGERGLGDVAPEDAGAGGADDGEVSTARQGRRVFSVQQYLDRVVAAPARLSIVA